MRQIRANVARTVLAALAVGAIGASAPSAPSAAAAAPAATDGLTAVNVVPPGESGNTTLTQFAAATAGLSNSFGPNTADQESLYATWRYKPMQFADGAGSSPPGDAAVHIWRDPTYDVPTIDGATESDTFYGLGYAMAQDRLFQMEVFRHVGHGTLASLVGVSGLTMDEQVRRFSEGSPALLAEFNALPADVRQRGQRFVDGINAYVGQVQGNPLTMPAEFTLLNDAPIKPWTIADVLGFGEYAGRFFGEFGHGELTDAVALEHLIARYGQARGEQVFNDLVPLNDPRAPTSIAARDGRFPRHVGRAVRTTFRGSPYANHAPALLPRAAGLTGVAALVDRQQARLHQLQRRLALPRFGSNAVVVSSRLSADHHAMLYGGPQTGWAVPGFFWEAELHDPVRDQRGVFVPAIPVMVIGRNATAAWTVTSALDANEDVYAEQLDRSNSTYVHDGHRLTVSKRTETIPCNNPATAFTPLLSGSAPKLCPSTPDTITIYRTIHGPSLANPDAAHQLFVRKSVVDGRLLQSLTAWDLAGRQSTVTGFGAALRNMSLGFNFFYADDHRHIGYWHTGTYPIRAANADPRLPLPGNGRYDWQGFESWGAHPHVIDPRAGYVVNWNNKPSTGWYSKNLETGGEGGIWGDGWESQPLAADVAARAPLTLQTLGQVPRDVAYIDNPARELLPSLLAALTHATDPQLVKVRGYLTGWNGRRDAVNASGGYATPAVVFFDRYVEALMREVEQPVLGADWVGFAGLRCATCTLTSVDNLSAPTYKFEYAGEELLLSALHGHTRFAWLANPTATLLHAARDAAATLTAAQGSDPANWNEPAEHTSFSAQGAVSVPDIVPLMNRGSYGQVVETR